MIGAGLLYSAIVYAAGFAFGIVRVVFLAPWIGTAAAIWIEVPAMLAVSWFACGFVLRRMRVAPNWRTRAGLGCTAFAALIAGEVALGMLAVGRSLAEALAAFYEPENLPGTAAQILFALMPLARHRRL